MYLANNEVLNAKAFNGSDTPIAVMTDTGVKQIGTKTSADHLVAFGADENGNGGLQIVNLLGENRSYLQRPCFFVDPQRRNRVRRHGRAGRANLPQDSDRSGFVVLP